MGDVETSAINLDNLIFQLDGSTEDSSDDGDEENSKPNRASRRALEDYLEEKRLRKLLEDDFLME